MNVHEIVHHVTLGDWLLVVEIVVLVCGHLLTLCGILLALRQLGLSNRKDAIDRALEAAKCPKIAAIRELLERLFPPQRFANRPIPLALLRVELEAGRISFAELTELLHHYDLLAICIKTGCTHEDIAFKFAGDHLVRCVTSPSEFIALECRVRGKAKYPALINLSRKWRSRL